MSLKVSIIDTLAPDLSTGLGGANEGHLQGFQDDVTSGVIGGVVDKAGGHALVTENSPAGMSVLVSDGIVYVPNSEYAEFDITETKFWRVIVESEAALTIGNNASGLTRIDLICVFVDKTIESNNYASNVATLEVVAGTPGSGVPATPADHYVLAQVTVANGETAINTADITDTRDQLTLKGINDDLILLKQESTPDTAAEGEVRVVVGSESYGNDNGLSIISSDNYRNDVEFNQFMARQAIVNGSFLVHQTSDIGAAGSYTDPVSATQTVDAWRVDWGTTGVMPTITNRRYVDTELPDSPWSYRLIASGAGSGFGANDLYFIRQRIERATRQLLGTGRKMTVSFWARSSIAGKLLGLKILANYGTTGTPTASANIGATYFTLTTSWARYTLTFDLPDLAGKSFGTDENDYLSIDFGVMWGSSIASQFNASGAEDFRGALNLDIKNVHAHLGDVVLPYYSHSYAETLRQCMRYRQVFSGDGTGRRIGMGMAVLTTDSQILVPLTVPMYRLPTLSYSSVSDFALTDGVTVTALTALSVFTARSDERNVILNAVVAAGLTQYRPYYLHIDSANSTKHLTLDALI